MLLMRLPKLLLLSVFCILAVTASARGETGVTVAQLEAFLLSKNTGKLSDAEIAERLSSTALSEQLTDLHLQQLLTQAHAGPKTAELLQVLTAESKLRPTPPSDWIQQAAPDPASQQAMLRRMRDHAQQVLQDWPDFVATRTTQTFDNTPLPGPTLHSKPVVHLHWASATQHEISYRHGQELLDLTAAADKPGEAAEGFSAWGEFGPILRTVLSDAVQGSIQWSHWQRSEQGSPIAVFRYVVPRAASHYSVDFCCYRPDEEMPMTRFKDSPGYHGEIWFDPAANSIAAISLLGDLGADSAMAESGMAVQYSPVRIGEKDFVCPVQSVIVSVVHNYELQKLSADDLEQHVNIVHFTRYHKFETQMRIVPAN